MSYHERGDGIFQAEKCIQPLKSRRSKRSARLKSASLRTAVLPNLISRRRTLMTESESTGFGGEMTVNSRIHRFPFCIVWTPLPLISWFLPFIGHMGIATSEGIIRDFAGSYYVSEDRMGFGWPTMYWQLNPKFVAGGVNSYDRAIAEASVEYEGHMHNIFCDNCHSHVAMALNLMEYQGKKNWNMVHLAIYILIHGKFVGLSGFLKQYLPILIIAAVIVALIVVPGFL